MTATAIKNVSPMLPTADMDRSLAFYADVLGFEPLMTSPDYSIVQRDGRHIHLQKTTSEEILESARKHMQLYIEVSGIDALWEHALTYKDRFRTRDLFDQEYGMTEFHIVDPSGCLVFVGEITRDRNAHYAAEPPQP